MSSVAGEYEVACGNGKWSMIQLDRIDTACIAGALIFNGELMVPAWRLQCS